MKDHAARPFDFDQRRRPSRLGSPISAADGSIDGGAVGNPGRIFSASAEISEMATQRSRLTASSRSSSASGIDVVIDPADSSDDHSSPSWIQKRRPIAGPRLSPACGFPPAFHRRDQPSRKGKHVVRGRRPPAVSSSTRRPASMLPAMEKSRRPEYARTNRRIRGPYARRSGPLHP